MGDMGDVFREWDRQKKERREANLDEFDPDGWTKHTDYHFSQTVAGKRLDYWPSKKKWMYDGKVATGSVEDFIAARDREAERLSAQGIAAQGKRPVKAQQSRIPKVSKASLDPQPSIFDTDDRLTGKTDEHL